jgi:hypothetical protein
MQSELQDQVFDFEGSELLLERADNWLNDDNKSTVSNKTGMSGMSGDRTYIDRNKKNAGHHTKYRRPMKGENLNDRQKDRLIAMMDDISNNLEDLKAEKESYYKIEGQSSISKFTHNNMYSLTGE